jgi:hypothetical protein
MIPLLGFMPDADAATPGVITDCTNFIPYENGMEGGPSASTPSDVPALAAACIGAGVLTNLAGTRRVIAGTATKLYELSAGAWSDITRASDYTGGADTRWYFAQFGDTTIATNRADEMQRSTGAGVDFADIAGAPKAEIVFTIGQQVMALNVNDGAEKTDGWHVSAVNDETDWTEALATLCASGRLVDTPGAITAGGRLGSFAVAYKAKGIYLGRFVGAPTVYQWELVPGGEAGCVGKEAWTDLGGVHFLVGDDNFWLFDGTRPVPIGNGAVRQWFYENSSAQYRYKTKCVFDRQNARVWVFYASTGSTSCDSALVYHVDAKKWGRADRTVEAVINYISSGLTYDTWDDAGSTYATLPDISYDSQFWLSGGQALSAFNSSHQLQTLTGDSVSSGFTTGEYGDDSQFSALTEVRLRYATGYSPSTATLQAYYKNEPDDSFSTGPSSTMANGRFSLLQDALWHQLAFSFTGPVRVTSGKPIFQAAGDR